MSSFKDTWTKANDNLLKYDDAASFYFMATIVTLVWVPVTLVLASRVIAGLQKIRGHGRALNCQCTLCVDRHRSLPAYKQWLHILYKHHVLIAVDVALLGLLWLLLSNLEHTATLQAFDPYEILGVSRGAELKVIKKAWRSLSVKWHPDRNWDPQAPAMFLRLSRAYSALTNEDARANYEKYGNPDGPELLKVGIGLPSVLVHEKHQLWVLIGFFSVLLVCIPLLCFWAYRRSSRQWTRHVSMPTVHLCATLLHERSSKTDVISLLAMSQESRELRAPSPRALLELLLHNQLDMAKDKSDSVPNVMFNRIALTLRIFHSDDTTQLKPPPGARAAATPGAPTPDATTLHGWERHLPELAPYTAQLYVAMLPVVDVIIWIASEAGWWHALCEAMDVRRALLHGVAPLSSALLQLPHFSGEALRHATTGKQRVAALWAYRALPPPERRGLATLPESHKADIQAYLMRLSQVELDARFIVDGEEDVCVDDVCTVEVTLTRTNLHKDAALGNAHAPNWPKDVHESWWVYLLQIKEEPAGETVQGGVAKGADGTYQAVGAPPGDIMGYHHLRGLGRTNTCKFYFRVARQTALCVYAFNSSVKGADARRVFRLEIRPRKKLVVTIHEEDRALDDAPSFFESLQGPNSDDDQEEIETDAQGNVTVLKTIKRDQKPDEPAAQDTSDSD